MRGRFQAAGGYDRMRTGALGPPRVATEQDTIADLRRSQELTRRLIEAMPGGVVHVAIDGAIQRANAEALRILGLSHDEITGKYTVDFETQTIFEDGSPCAVADYPVTKALMTGQAQAPVTIGVRRPDGEVAWAVFTAVPVKDEDGATTGAVVTFLDITARKQLEADLVQARKMEGLGRLAGGIAHDFNNLLTVMMGNAQGLERSFAETDPRLEDVEQIRHAALHGATLTRQLMSFASRQPSVAVVVDVERLLREMAAMLGRTLGERIDLRVRCDEDLWQVRIDPGQFEQVLINLAVNARDAMPDGGEFCLGARNLSGGGDGDVVLLSVSDTGVGIAPADLECIFEPFFTTKPPGSGIGLGLATCYGIIHRAGGSIRALSELGKGTTFEIRLPRSLEPARSEGPTASGPATGGTETILIIEDDPLVRSFTERSLVGLGYSVLSARTGEEALEMLDGRSSPIDLLLADMVLPGMSGPAMASKLRQAHPGVRVLYISGYPDDESGQHAELGPEAAFLSKPFAPEDLDRKVRELLDRAD